MRADFIITIASNLSLVFIAWSFLLYQYKNHAQNDLSSEGNIVMLSYTYTEQLDSKLYLSFSWLYIPQRLIMYLSIAAFFQAIGYIMVKNCLCTCNMWHT